MTRTFAIAVDGMESSLVERWADDLPNLSRMKTDGAYGPLHCETGSSASQWTTHFTGVYKDRHGITGFTRSGRRDAGDTSPDVNHLINLTDIQILTYPEYLDRHGVSVGLVNPLPLWPPLELDSGYCISGLLTPPTSESWVSPPELADELNQRDYRIDIKYGNRPYGFIDDDLFDEVSLSDLRADLFDVMQTRIETAKWLIETRETDFTYVLVKAIDVLQHCFWAYIDIDDGKATKFRNTIKRGYKLVDDFVEWLDAYVNGNLVVFSDHGFGPRMDTSGLLNSVASRIATSVDVPEVAVDIYSRLFGRPAGHANPDTGDPLNPGRLTGAHELPAMYVATGPDVVASGRLPLDFVDLTGAVVSSCGVPVPATYEGSAKRLLSGVEYEDVCLQTRRTPISGSDVTDRLYNLGYAEMADYL